LNTNGFRAFSGTIRDSSANACIQQAAKNRTNTEENTWIIEKHGLLWPESVLVPRAGNQ
jgi:hypothetical protein